MNSTKKCSQCKIEKEIIFFAKNSSRYDKLQHICKMCQKNNNILKKEYLKERHHSYYIKNSEKIKEQSTKNYYENIQKNKKRSAVYREKNKLKISESNKKYRETINYKISHKNKEGKRREIIKSSNLKKDLLIELVLKTKKCYWCGCDLKNVSVHIDHYKPLSKGGEHTLENLVISCKTCNLKKGTKDPFIFAIENGRLL